MSATNGKDSAEISTPQNSGVNLHRQIIRVIFMPVRENCQTRQTPTLFYASEIYHLPRNDSEFFNHGTWQMNWKKFFEKYHPELKQAFADSQRYTDWLLTNHLNVIQ